MANPLIRERPQDGSYRAPVATLECIIERVTFHNSESGYSVVKVLPADVKDKVKADVITVLGSFTNPVVGESLLLYGEWVKHPQFGHQFKMEKYETIRPATAAAIEKYLGSGMVKGVGKVMAKRIVDKFGERALDIIEETPEKLTQVSGIGEKRIGMIKAAWDEQREVRTIMLFLQGHGVTPTFAVKIYRRYKERSIEVVEQNPYQLATDIWGIGFKSADKIAMNLGMAEDAPERLEAGLVYVLNQEMDNGGHCFLYEDDLIKKACDILLAQTAPEGDEPADVKSKKQALAIERALQSLIERELLVAETVELMGVRDTAIYTPSIHQTEKLTAERINQLLNSPWRSRPKPNELDEVMKGLTGYDTLSEEQQAAVRRALCEPIMVLTGGPGTGKCVVGDTLVLSVDGLRTMKMHWDIATGNVVTTPNGWTRHANVIGNPDTFQTYETIVAAREGTATTSHAYYGGKRHTRRICTGLGLELEGTPNHRVWAVTTGGADWIRLEDITPGTRVAVSKGDNLWPQKPANTTRGRMLGQRIGLELENREQVAFRESLLCADRITALAFLKSLFDEAGRMHDDGTLSLEGRDVTALSAIQLLLLNIGIVSQRKRTDSGAILYLAGDQSEKLLRGIAGEPAENRELIWDTVDSISESEAEVYDLTVPGQETFVANGLVNHNTTTTRAVVAAFEKMGKRLQLASPTGRAAKRAAEVTGKEAKTIHRLLVFDPEKKGFKHGPGEPLELDVLVVDESSMLDLHLMYSVLKAVPDGAQIVFVGDVDQLPSVGPGNVLADLINSGRVPVARLTQVFRQAAQSKIITNAHAINKGKMPDLLPPSAIQSEGADCVFLEVEESDEMPTKLAGVVAKSLPKLGYKADDITVLAPMQRGSVGAKNLNEILQGVLNPPHAAKEEHIRGPIVFRVGDRVMQRVNNYDKNVFNGDVGIILSVDKENQTVGVNYPEGPVEYDFVDMDQLAHAFALTIHKCIRQNERVSTATRGLVPIRDLRVGECIYTGRGELRQVRAVVPTGRKPVFRVTTAAGFQIDASAEHPLLVATPDTTEPVWKTIGELTPGVFACISREVVAPTTPVLLPQIEKPVGNRACPVMPTYLTEELAYLLGALVGDGSYRDRKDGTVDFTNQDEAVLARVAEIQTGYGLRVCRHQTGTRATRLYVVSRSYRAWLQKLGLDYVLAPEKSIPWPIFSGSVACKAAFLRGLFDTDGSAGQGTCRLVRLVTASERLARETQELLLSLGIVARRSKVGPNAWCLGVGGPSLCPFAERIGFTVDYKQERLDHLRELAGETGKTNVDYIPFGQLLAQEVYDAVLESTGTKAGRGGPRKFLNEDATAASHLFGRLRGGSVKMSYQHLDTMIQIGVSCNASVPESARRLQAQRFFFDPIVSVEQISEEDEMFDIEVEGIHSFVAGGFVCHNSQGSEYPACIIAIHTQHYMMLQRNLIYTALTRAKKIAVFVGSRRAIQMAVKNRNVVPRNTRLSQRLQQLVEELGPLGREQKKAGANGKAPLPTPPIPGRLL